jgi:hypothetical protein
VAQWLGQFSGHTHATRAEDAETTLRHAVAVFRAASSADDRNRKARSVRSLAERLLSARLKLLKARLAALQPVAEGADKQSGNLKSLREREAQTRTDGIRGILVEFGALDALA